MAETPLAGIDFAKLEPESALKEIRDVNFKLSNVELLDEHDKSLDWKILDAVVEAKLELTTTGASTLTVVVEDPDREFLNDPIMVGLTYALENVAPSSARTFSSKGKITAAKKNTKYGEEADWEWGIHEVPIDLKLDGIYFRCIGFKVKELQLELLFEDRAATLLREHVGLITRERGQMTRAQFIEMLAKQVIAYGGVPVFIPESAIIQPESEDSSEETTTKSGSLKTLGISDGLTSKGVAITASQAKVLNEALRQAATDKAPFKAAVALVEALIVENDCSNPDPGTAEDMGCLSVIAETNRGINAVVKFNPYDIKEAAHYFLVHGWSANGTLGAIHYARNEPHFSAGEIAQQVQGSAHPNAYGERKAEAEAIVRSFNGAAGKTESGAALTYQFLRGPNESSWDAIQRLAGEVQWYAFIRDNRLWYVSGDYLYSQAAEYTLEEGTDGIEWIEPDVDFGARDGIAECTVKGRADLWAFLQGMLVKLAGVGPANGKWMVDVIEIDLCDDGDAVELTLQKPLPARAEPAGTTEKEAETSLSGKEEGSTASGAERPKAAWNPNDKPIAKWIVPILKWAVAHGWKGEVVSGYRTDSEQIAAATKYAAELGVPVLHEYPDGPLASNHCGTTYPKGAVDVTEAAELNSILHSYPNSPTLIWAENTIEDGVHFSSNGH